MVGQWKPPQFIVVFKGQRLTMGYLSEPHAHAGVFVQRPTAGLLRREFTTEAHPDSQFLKQFPDKPRFRVFTGFHFAARKLPESGKLLRRTPPGHQQHGWTGQAVHYSAAHYVYQSSRRFLHRFSLWGTIGVPGMASAPTGIPFPSPGFPQRSRVLLPPHCRGGLPTS